MRRGFNYAWANIANLTNLARDEILIERFNLAKFRARDLRDFHPIQTKEILIFSKNYRDKMAVLQALHEQVTLV